MCVFSLCSCVLVCQKTNERTNEKTFHTCVDRVWQRERLNEHKEECVNEWKRERVKYTDSSIDSASVSASEWMHVCACVCFSANKYEHCKFVSIGAQTEKDRVRANDSAISIYVYGITWEATERHEERTHSHTCTHTHTYTCILNHSLARLQTRPV